MASNIWKMADVLGGYARDEQQMRNFAKPEVRQKIALLIDDCKGADSKALEYLKILRDSM